MRLKIEQYDTMQCGAVDAPLERLIEQIRLYGFALQGKKEGTTTLIPPEEIFYFESIEGKTFGWLELRRSYLLMIFAMAFVGRNASPAGL